MPTSKLQRTIDENEVTPPPHVYYTIDVLQRVGIVTDDENGVAHPPFRAAMMMVADYFAENVKGPDEEYEFVLQDPRDAAHKTTVTVKS